MKKTIIALMALTGVAMGADTTAADLQDLLTTELAESGYTVEGNFSYTLSFTMTGDIPYTGGNGKYTLKLADSYYLLSQAHQYWGLGAGQDGVTTDTSTYTFSKNTAGTEYTYTSKEDSFIYTWTRNADNTDSSTRSLGNPAGVSVTLESDGTDSILTLSYNGSTITDKFVFKGTEFDLSAIGINPTPTLSSMSVSINSIPEPTTATLSLLALSGLAARRRRR